MFGNLRYWIDHRLLRLSHATVVAASKRLGVSPDKIEKANDAIAGAVADAVSKAADRAAAQAVTRSMPQGVENDDSQS